MKVANASVGSVVVDSLPYSQGGTRDQAEALKASGVDAFAGYLGCMNAARLAAVLDAGLAFIPVTLAGEYSDGPADEVAELKTLGIPKGTTVFLDLEGMTAFKTDAPALIAKINTWADGISAAGYVPGLYVGVPQPLTSAELYGLRVQRYWRGQGSVRDRSNALAEPAGCGWCHDADVPLRHARRRLRRLQHDRRRLQGPRSDLGCRRVSPYRDAQPPAEGRVELARWFVHVLRWLTLS